MFEIEYNGGNTVNIVTKKVKLVFDPRASLVGLKDVINKDAVELLTEPKFAVDNEDRRLVISLPGEYGVGDVDVLAIAAKSRLDSDEPNQFSSVIYKLNIGEHRVVVIGNISENISEDQYEKIGSVDILIIPVGNNGYTLDSHGANKIIKNIEPKIVVPIHYDDGKSIYEVAQDNIEKFLKDINAPYEKNNKLKIKNGFSYPSSLSVVVLEAV